ncbi:RluA family pseudouridine synthase [Lutimonas zeaxanthinifaciens]|uniref:RluA family pseudouridine synthase n=1 Tax=Lutimonas zeaxanthinifaciens TaxID=3060215 RepID=UPI00265D34C0|nr:RNA pseudouridine synthase [Lutimonas sp. YSD2104]WKK65400.1 RNA pseudouridine synthase [Lutimonas sp. YSD2104]
MKRSTKDNLQVLYEDNHLLVVNKRVGDIVQGDKTGDKPLSEVVKEYLAEKYQKPGKVFLGVVHRLDRPTTGIVIFARTSKALERMNKMLRDKKINKTYWALVEGVPDIKKDTLEHYLKKNPKNNKSTAFPKASTGTKKAILHYTVLLELDRYSLLEINLETGRHHQIRTQLSVIGNPIKGDLKYGSKRSNKDGGINLHAVKIDFLHPVKKEKISLEAPRPSEVLWEICDSKMLNS